MNGDMPLEMGSGLDVAPSTSCWPLREKYSGPAVDRSGMVFHLVIGSTFILVSLLVLG